MSDREARHGLCVLLSSLSGSQAQSVHGLCKRTAGWLSSWLPAAAAAVPPSAESPDAGPTANPCEEGAESLSTAGAATASEGCEESLSAFSDGSDT